MELNEIPDDFLEPVVPIDKYAFIANETLFKDVFLADNSIEFTVRKEKLKDLAKTKFGIGTRDFDRIFKNHHIKFNASLKTQGSNVTQFTSSTLNLNCGDWIAKDTGVYRVKITEFEEIKVIASPIPIIISEIYINIQENTEKVKLEFCKKGVWQSLIVDKSTISNTQKIINLSDLGVDVTSVTAKDLVIYLFDLLRLNEENIPTLKSTNKLGWTKLEDETVFVPYTDEIKFDNEAKFFSLYESLKSKGNYENWKKATAKLRDRNILSRLIIATSFSSALVEKLDALPFILHLWGGTESGKTVMQIVAASVWGDPHFGKLMFSLKNTAVSFEVTSNVLNNIPMICDELQELKGNYLYKDGFDKLVMMLCSGIGNGRGTKDGGKQTLNKWLNCFILSGEDPLTNTHMGGGAKNRTIEVEALEKMVIDGTEGGNIASFFRENFGFAGKEFIEILKTVSHDEIKMIYKNFSSELFEVTSDKQGLSMALILTADYLISKYMFNTQPLNIQDVEKFVMSKNEINVYERSYEWLLSFVDVNKIRFNQDTEINRGEIWGKMTEGYVFINKPVLEAKMKSEGFNFRAVSNKWAEMGYIQKDSSGKLTTGTRLKGRTGLERLLKIRYNNDAQILFDGEIDDDIPKELI